MNESVYFDYVESPLGRLLVRGDGEFVTGLYLPNHKTGSVPGVSWRRASAPFEAAREQLHEYFAGSRREFDFPVEMASTPFQRLVWRELTRIPFGATITYAELARRAGNPTASRAVGAANGMNPISIVVPCHRVIGVGGKLTGYAGGVETKRLLLEWERRVLDGESSAFSAVRETRSA